MSVDPHGPEQGAFAGPLDLNASPSVLAIWGLAFLLIYFGRKVLYKLMAVDHEK